jgi:peptidoglycan/xylan/chitin deacetylase (PgdA/CDA1 family)
MRRRVRRLASEVLYRNGHIGRFVRRLRPRAVVLAYHRVGPASFDPFGQGVRPETFQNQLEHLRRHYHVISVEALTDALQQRTLVDRSVAVSFDDGYADNLHTALPIAAASGVPITVFVTVNGLLGQGLFWWDQLAAAIFAKHGDSGAAYTAALAAQRELKSLMPEVRERRLAAWGATDVRESPRPMTLDELEQLAGAPGVSIGAHTMSHRQLSLLPPDDQRHELHECRTALQQLTGQPIRHVAYPFGKRPDVTAETVKIARAAGYEYGFATCPEAVLPHSDRFFLPRIIVHEWPLAVFAQRLSNVFAEA